MYTVEEFLYVHSSNDHIKKWILLSIFECHCCHPFISKWLFEKDPPLPILSKVIIINCKIRQKNQPLCLIIAFDLRHIYVQISCAEHTIRLIIGLSMTCHEKCVHDQLLIFRSSKFNFFSSQWSKWNDVRWGKKNEKTTTVHFVIMVMATAVYSTWIFN
jgi:preprotein translocase subunit SecE